MRVFYANTIGDGDEIRSEVVSSTRPGYWKCPTRCIAHVRLDFPQPVHESDGMVRIDIGDKPFTLPLRNLDRYGNNYLLPDEVNYGPTPTFAYCRNWPGTEVFLKYYAARTAPGMATLLILTLATAIGMREPFRKWFQSILVFDDQQRETHLRSVAKLDWSWNAVGWLFLIGGFVGLEIMQPYYFTQDDALLGELPGILLGCRSLWEGTFPDWNPYVFMGSPLATIGFWAITYPPQLLCLCDRAAPPRQ